MEKRVALITGASSGIGKALALKFAQENFNVVLAARNEQALKQLVEEIELKQQSAIYIITDVAKEEDCKNLIKDTISYFGKIDVLINNAGISMRAIFETTAIDVIEKVMQINFFGAVYCTKYALPYIISSQGSIIAISSIAGYRGLPGRTGYSASKFAMHGFFQSLRLENLKHKLHVLIACPGYTASNIRNAALNADGNAQSETPLNETKLMQAGEVAKIIFNGYVKKSDEIIMTKEGKIAVLLAKFFPAILDILIYKKVKKEHGSPF